MQDIAKNHHLNLIKAIKKYKNAPIYTRTEQSIYQINNAKLLYEGDFSVSPKNAKKPAILFVPSLINRHYILNLSDEYSFTKYMQDQNFSTYLIDWGKVLDKEKYYNLGDYVTEILIPMIKYLRYIGYKKIILAGYCLGGILSIGAVSINPKIVDAIAFLATPWDFSENKITNLGILQNYINSNDVFSGKNILAMFYMRDVFRYQQKLISSLNMNEAEYSHFVNVEDWINDSSDIGAKIASQCFIDWNINGINSWKINDKTVNPENINIPSFTAIANNDNVVSKQSAMKLVNILPNNQHIKINSGHIGMIIGKNSRNNLWDKFSNWADQ